MSRKSAINDEDLDRVHTDIEVDREKNEYELFREANIARNMAILQPVIEAANEFNSAFGLDKRKSKPKQGVQTHLPLRRSGRLSSGTPREIEVHGDSDDSKGSRLVHERHSAGAFDYNEPEYGDSESPSDASAGRCQNPLPDSVHSSMKRKAKVAHSDGSPSRRNRQTCGNVKDGRPWFGNFNTSQTGHMFPTSSSNPMQAPAGWTWVPVPHNQSGADMFDVLGGFSQGKFPPNWQCLPSDSIPSMGGFQETGADKADDNAVSRSSSIKEESVKKRIRRANKREADEEARRRESAGMKPFAVQVRPSGIIDCGCKGHLKWQEYVRDLTPRILDMSVIKYEDQQEGSRSKLRDTLNAKFEFLDHEVTEVSFDKMIKTWLRRDRERVRRVHGGNVKAPSKYSEKEWDAMKKYWESSSYKMKSEKMSETRRKVVFNPRVGRHGYAGKEAKLRRERDISPGVTDLADEIRASQENPISVDVEKKNSNRLSAMERNQIDTNRRLDDVMKSNLNLQNMLRTVLSNLSGTDVVEGAHVESACVRIPGETSGNGAGGNFHIEGDSGGLGSSEQWWDILCRTSVEEEDADDRNENNVSTNPSSKNQKRCMDNEIANRKAKQNSEGLKVLNALPGVFESVNAVKELDETRTKRVVGKEKMIEKDLGKERRAAKNKDNEIKIGDKVWLADTLDPAACVATGTVLGLGGHGAFHNRPIPLQYVRVNVEEVLVNLPLMIPVEEADQANLNDARGSSVLWFRGLTFVQE